jgi:hypothetical protein
MHGRDRSVKIRTTIYCNEKKVRALFTVYCGNRQIFRRNSDDKGGQEIGKSLGLEQKEALGAE